MFVCLPAFFVCVSVRLLYLFSLVLVSWMVGWFLCLLLLMRLDCLTLSVVQLSDILEQWAGDGRGVCWLVGCLTSQQHASVSQGRICTDNFTCCHTEIEVADQTFHLTQSHYTDTRPTSPNADPITPGAWQGSHWSANV